ncbi:hypothetical protein Q9290_14260 [Oceanimonas sp. CHS3-5]|uniref:hypothetical protein n=1 Tax=Oceanimonas sp. CHS3-5 TaxID=3068186 RepID=UPI00273DDDAE|nr:hypothetical protein [Oceanimonas sp. CHS3-5]MDP5293445.1 hypothetical protein [Oceanimonas sp. CHS3-5]
MSLWKNCSNGAGCKALHTMAVAMLSAFILILAMPAQATDVQPVVVPGNAECTLGEGQSFFKIDESLLGGYGETTAHYDDETGTWFFITRINESTFNWYVEGGVVYSVGVKGGPDTNVYNYPNGATSDTGLMTPTNPRNGSQPGISHISFCYEPGAPSIDITKNCDGTDLNGMVATYNYTATITNDGDFPLTNIELKEAQNGFDSCVINTLDGNSVTEQPLTLGSYVSINGVGTLDPGDYVDVGITCTADEINLVNDISTRGTYDGEYVSDMTSATCQFTPDPMVSVDKTCPYDESVRLMAMEGMLVAEVCPVITVKNTGAETLSSVVLNDPALPELAALGNIGPMAPGATIVIDEYCYLPAAPAGATWDDFLGVVADPIDPIEGTEDKYATATAAFFNKVTVDAIGFFGGSDSDSDTTYSWDDEKQEWVAECPLCAPCPECETNGEY